MHRARTPFDAFKEVPVRISRTLLVACDSNRTCVVYIA